MLLCAIIHLIKLEKNNSQSFYFFGLYSSHTFTHSWRLIQETRLQFAEHTLIRTLFSVGILQTCRLYTIENPPTTDFMVPPVAVAGYKAFYNNIECKKVAVKYLSQKSKLVSIACACTSSIPIWI